MSDAGVKIGKLNKDNHYGSMSPFSTDFMVFASCREQPSVLENVYRSHYRSQNILRVSFLLMLLFILMLCCCFFQNVL